MWGKLCRQPCRESASKAEPMSMTHSGKNANSIYPSWKNVDALLSIVGTHPAFANLTTGADAKPRAVIVSRSSWAQPNHSSSVLPAIPCKGCR